MYQSKPINRAIVLKSRPVGDPSVENFRLEEREIPVPSQGQVLLRTHFLSLDPYMRGRMSDGPSYAASIAIGDVMVGGTVSRIESSSHRDYKIGDMVLSFSGWQDYAISNGKGVTKLNFDKHHPSLALGILGMPGFTAYMALLDIGQPKPGETAVVAAATGAVSAAVGQIAKIKECRAVGIAGGV
jgi:NADPH-dependent curcumin reductase